MESDSPTPMKSDDCNGSLHPRAIKGIKLFNSGHYFEAHEELEAAWMEEKGAIRDLYRGILQVAVAYYHILHGNYTGARKMIQRCSRWLTPLPNWCRGVDVGRLRVHYENLDRMLVSLGPDRIHLFEFEKFVIDL